MSVPTRQTIAKSPSPCPLEIADLFKVINVAKEQESTLRTSARQL
jgi:hypothetical protein